MKKQFETSYVGYEPNVMKEVLVAGVKEVVIDIQLRENNLMYFVRQKEYGMALCIG